MVCDEMAINNGNTVKKFDATVFAASMCRAM